MVELGFLHLFLSLRVKTQEKRRWLKSIEQMFVSQELGESQHMARVVVIGGGVIGCAIAERLTLDRHQVTLLERDQLGCRASGAAAGDLSPHNEETGGVPEPAARSLQMFPELVARIEKDSGMKVDYHLQQALEVAFDETESGKLKSSGGRWLDAQACRDAEPSLTSDVLGAVLRQEAYITPPRFVRALARAAAVRGAEIREGTPAIGFEVADGEVRRVIATDGAIDADWFVIAAGPWSKEVAMRAGVNVEVRPQRGQLALINPGSVALARTVFWSSGYLVPKPDGTVVVGSTEEESGFDDRPTVAGVAPLLDFARRVVPGFGDATVERIWAGLRPVTPSGEAVVGPVAGIANLIVATGHHRQGILLAPAAALTVATAIK
jgi:glycine oxidase